MPLWVLQCVCFATSGGLARQLVDMSLRTILIDKSVPKVAWSGRSLRQKLLLAEAVELVQKADRASALKP